MPAFGLEPPMPELVSIFFVPFFVIVAVVAFSLVSLFETFFSLRLKVTRHEPLWSWRLDSTGLKSEWILRWEQAQPCLNGAGLWFQQISDSTMTDTGSGGISTEATAAKRLNVMNTQSEENEFVIEHGRRFVVPYHVTLHMNCKGRWFGRTVLQVFQQDFPFQSSSYFEKAVGTGRLVALRKGQPLPPNEFLKVCDLTSSVESIVDFARLDDWYLRGCKEQPTQHMTLTSFCIVFPVVIDPERRHCVPQGASPRAIHSQSVCQSACDAMHR